MPILRLCEYITCITRIVKFLNVWNNFKLWNRNYWYKNFNFNEIISNQKGIGFYSQVIAANEPSVKTLSVL